ncbi:RNA polymerase sigma factor [Zunongwangia endophytica]|uniref:RNA polymerase sigma factor n=1 Tax=Zunongwangia endophytica TaxID=1808945 RepID=A0ABV8H541_9FLAO|nr:RNA polymerase sigma-70 factor [Zunongwangia endophytica]MDN3595558.1 RNA polymerase sigma-70 factor [Zunongwangia endophytica]
MTKTFSDNVCLINSLKKGNEDAYKYLINIYHHKLYVYACHLIADKDLAEDIVQNVFIKIWKNKENLKPTLSIKNLLYKSVYNEFLDQYRKNKKTIYLEKKYIDTLSSIVEEESEHSLDQLIAIVRNEIEKLPPKCKQTFLLSKKEGLTNTEIADYLNISIKSVEKHITKAFSTLRLKVGDANSHIFLFLHKLI